MNKPKLIRIATVPMSLHFLLKGQLQFMSQYFETVGVSSGPKDELEVVAKRESIKVRQVEMSRAITPIKDIKSLWQLYKLFKKEKPIVVHTHTPKAGIVGMMAASFAGVPIRLHTVAGMPLMEANGIKRNIFNIVEKITYACATKVYPNSKGLEQFILENNYTKAEKIKVIANGSSNGIDTSHFDPQNHSQQQKQNLRNELDIHEEDFVFIFVGRLVGDKGINELVKAFKNLKFKIQNLKLLLVGPLESDSDPLLPETLKEIKNNSSIITTGFQNDVRPYLAISNALAFPSYREGFPNVVMQAGAMGLPSIVTDINGCNEIIKDGKNGMIIPPKNTDLLKKAMIKLIEDTELYNSLKSNARKMITSRYEQKIVWQALLEEYRTLLNEKRI